ncbi:MAG TPA: hypothetical protein VG248_01505 [Caulobacteraceae bacterium]|nr:hypothetical protein [Caulobacteraceae bacterium]
MTEKREALFYRYSWLGKSYYWPRHWLGWIIMLTAGFIAIQSLFFVASTFIKFHHPELQWMAIVAPGIAYCLFDAIADHHSRQ